MSNNKKTTNLIVVLCSAVIIIVSFCYFKYINSYTNDFIGEKTEVKFSKIKHKLEKIKLNSKHEIDFGFSNIGNVPLVIYSVNVSCECAITKRPKKPILPGDISKIKIIFKAKKSGVFHKTIRVFGNFKGSPKILTIKGIVS